MKQLFFILFFCVCLSSLKGQNDCFIKWPNNTQPDTVLSFIFMNKLIKVSSFRGAKPISNFSFKTKLFYVTWMTVNSKDVDDFMLRSIKSTNANQIIDTLSCNIWGQSHKIIVVKAKRNRLLYIYLKQFGLQDIFAVKVYKARDIQRAIDYLEFYLL